MKIMHTMASEAPANRPKRRFYSSELKTQVMQECRQSGASVSGVALSHGINANIVHRWLREQTQSALVPQSQVNMNANAFVPVTLNESAPSPVPHAELDIRVEVQRANSAIVVKWPLQDSAACATWLREWLR
jgi:transposase-like protein